MGEMCVCMCGVGRGGGVWLCWLWRSHFSVAPCDVAPLSLVWGGVGGRLDF